MAGTYSTRFPEVTLVKRSDGARGQYGARKAYEIYVKGFDSGNWIVFMAWGKAEMSRMSWMCTEKVFKSEEEAVAFAWAKFYDKIDKGYTERTYENN